MAQATFAAGCFWGIEAAFRRVEGVTATQVGYTGGATDVPTNEQVCSGRTGHAEAVRVTFDPGLVGYAELLGVFYSIHDATQLNRQGADVGTQYRSAVFFHDAEQEATARELKAEQQASGRWGGEIVTEIVPAGAFHPAEDYHQQYLAKHGQDACSSTIQR